MDLQHPPGKSLTKHILDLLKLAQEKGFPNYIEYYDPLEVKSWRHDEFVFCAVVCAALQTWLRKKYRISIWIVPEGREQNWRGYIRHYGHWGSTTDATPVINGISYEHELINAIVIALNALPPAAQE